MSMRYLESSVEGVSTAAGRATPAAARCFAARNFHFFRGGSIVSSTGASDRSWSCTPSVI
jgi:hypothetical protein